MQAIYYPQIPNISSPKRFDVLSLIYSIVTILSSVHYFIIFAISNTIVQIMIDTKYPERTILIGKICVAIMGVGLLSQIGSVIISCMYHYFELAGKIYFFLMYLIQVVLHYFAYNFLQEVWQKINEGDIRKPLLSLVILLIFMNGFLLTINAVIFTFYLFIPPKAQEFVYQPILKPYPNAEVNNEKIPHYIQMQFQ